MQRSLIDRWTDTAPFRLVLFFSGLVAVPVLLLGLVTTVGLLAAAVASRRAELEGAAVVLLSVGGALGLLGYLRAHAGAKDPSRHALTATLLCLAIGIATALFVAGAVAAEAIESWLSPRGSARWLAFAAPFVAAHVVWAVAGVAWMQRLSRGYAEKTGRLFDTVPAMMLFVALALATSAVLVTTAL
jgi:hypothetical protein